MISAFCADGNEIDGIPSIIPILQSGWWYTVFIPVFVVVWIHYAIYCFWEIENDGLMTFVVGTMRYHATRVVQPYALPKPFYHYIIVFQNNTVHSVIYVRYGTYHLFPKCKDTTLQTNCQYKKSDFLKIYTINYKAACDSGSDPYFQECLLSVLVPEGRHLNNPR